VDFLTTKLWSGLAVDMDENCNPTFGKVDSILDLLTKSKSLHVLMELDRDENPLRFTGIKRRVRSSSTTVSRRIKEVEAAGLVARYLHDDDSRSAVYVLTAKGKKLSPVMQSLYEWAEGWSISPTTMIDS
jgi:DNA-binding HxlR family transcriptional regulator